MIRNRFAVFATALSLALPMAAATAQTPNFQGRNALNQADATCTADGDNGSTRCVSYYHAAQNITILNNWGFGDAVYDPTGSAGSAQAFAESVGFAATRLSGWILPSSAMFGSIFSAVGGTQTGLAEQFYGYVPGTRRLYWTTDGERVTSNGLKWRTCATTQDMTTGNLAFQSCLFENQGVPYVQATLLAVFTGDVLVPVEPPVTTVPEPSTYALIAAGLAALGIVSRRRRRALVA